MDEVGIYKPKSMRNAYGMLSTDAARACESEIHYALREIIRRWLEDGYDEVEIEHIAVGAATSLCAEARILRTLTLLKARREAEEKEQG